MATKAVLATKVTKNTKGFSVLSVLGVLCGQFVFVAFVAATAAAQELPPELTLPVNDFAHVIDDPSKNRSAQNSQLHRALSDLAIGCT